MALRLGILDQSPIFPGKTAYDALQSTMHLARQAEKWGYSRFWVSEHHQGADIAGSSPEVLISHLLANTNTIKVGSGGIMLQHYSPYKVAENFHLLATLAPGRVELGVGKAPGGFPLSTKALRFGTTANGGDFNERLAFLQQIASDTVQENHPLYGVKALPKPSEILPLFLLGASPNSARQAAELGMNFVFARFLNGNNSILEESVQAYRATNPNGKFIIAVTTFAAPDQKEAEELVRSQKIYKIFLESGKSFSVQSLEQLHAYEEQAVEPFHYEEQETSILAGTPEFVLEELNQLAKSYQVDEFILHTPIFNEKERLKSYQLLSPANANNKLKHGDDSFASST